MNFREMASNHKAIGAQYLWTGLSMLLLGIILTLVLRARSLPAIDDLNPNSYYACLRATHGTILVFFGIVPVIFSAFGNYVIPAGSNNRMAFPQLNLVGLILFYLSTVLMLGSLLVRNHQTFIMAMGLNIASTLLCSINFIATIFQLHKSGVRWMQMRFVVWSLFATAALVLLTFLPLEAAAVMQFGHSFRDSLYWAAPSHSATDASTPSLWNHAFWFLGHPEVYILFLFLLGIFLEGFKILVQRVIREV